MTPHKIHGEILHSFILRLLSRRAGRLNVRLQCATDDPTLRAYRNLMTPTLSMPSPSRFAALTAVALHTDLTRAEVQPYLAARASLPNGETARRGAINNITTAASSLPGDMPAIHPLSPAPGDPAE